MSATLLNAPCIFCGYSGREYWQARSHATTCPWHEIGGEEQRAGYLRPELTRLTAQVAELQAKCEAKQKAIDGLLELCAEADKKIQSAIRERDEARAAAGAMREALERAATYVELTYDEEGGEEAAEAKRDLDMCNKALAPTIGAEVMRVVEAARKAVLDEREPNGGAVWLRSDYADELADALAALRTEPDRDMPGEDGNG